MHSILNTTKTNSRTLRRMSKKDLKIFASVEVAPHEAALYFCVNQCNSGIEEQFQFLREKIDAVETSESIRTEFGKENRKCFTSTTPEM